MLRTFPVTFIQLASYISTFGSAQLYSRLGIVCNYRFLLLITVAFMSQNAVNLLLQQTANRCVYPLLILHTNSSIIDYICCCTESVDCCNFADWGAIQAAQHHLRLVLLFATLSTTQPTCGSRYQTVFLGQLQTSIALHKSIPIYY